MPRTGCTRRATCPLRHTPVLGTKLQPQNQWQGVALLPVLLSLSTYHLPGNQCQGLPVLPVLLSMIQTQLLGSTVL